MQRMNVLVTTDAVLGEIVMHTISQDTYVSVHKIIKIYDNVLWDSHYFTKYSHFQSKCGEYFAEYC